MGGAASAGMMAGGWLFLLLAWGLILGETVFCFRKLLKTQGRRTP